MSTNIREITWEDFDTVAHTCIVIICIACLVLIFVFVNHKCEEIVLTGNYCEVGHGWYWLTAAFVGIGGHSVWRLYRECWKKCGW